MPAASVGVAGTIEIDWRVADVTVMIDVAVLPMYVAVIVAMPGRDRRHGLAGDGRDRRRARREHGLRGDVARGAVGVVGRHGQRDRGPLRERRRGGRDLDARERGRAAVARAAVSGVGRDVGVGGDVVARWAVRLRAAVRARRAVSAARPVGPARAVTGCSAAASPIVAGNELRPQAPSDIAATSRLKGRTRFEK